MPLSLNSIVARLAALGLPTLSRVATLLDFLVRLVLAAEGAKFVELDTLGRGLLVLRIGVVLPFALGALEGDYFACHVIPKSPKRFPRPRSVRLRESQTASPCPWPPA